MGTKVINGSTFVVPGCDARKEEITPELRKMIEARVLENANFYPSASAFDLAVDISYDWELVSADDDWEIPTYVVEIAEQIMGAQDG